MLKNIIITLALLFFIAIRIEKSHAAMMYASNGNTYTTYTSIPYPSGFYFSDWSGNYISSTQSSGIPVIIHQYQNGTWISINNSNIPENAIVMHYINGYPYLQNTK